MSNCWKCGRELPDGRVECEFECPKLAPGAPNILRMEFCMIPDPKKVSTADQQRKFQEAITVFAMKIEAEFRKSELAKFGERP
jgi:hypothetical protein